MAVLGIGIGRLRLIDRHFRQNGFTGHRFRFRHALMAVVFLDERPSTQEWIGLGLVTAGVLTLALKR